METTATLQGAPMGMTLGNWVFLVLIAAGLVYCKYGPRLENVLAWLSLRLFAASEAVGWSKRVYRETLAMNPPAAQVDAVLAGLEH